MNKLLLFIVSFCSISLIASTSEYYGVKADPRRIPLGWPRKLMYLDWPFDPELIFKQVGKNWNIITDPLYRWLKIKSATKPVMGQGVFAVKSIPPRTLIGAYTGKIASPERMVDVSYRMNVPDKFIIDAKQAGNETRFINHSSTPNIGVQTIPIKTDNGVEELVSFFTLRPISADEELFIDYGKDYWHNIFMAALRQDPELIAQILQESPAFANESIQKNFAVSTYSTFPQLLDQMPPGEILRWFWNTHRKLCLELIQKLEIIENNSTPK